jgi:serine/threonine-protein phosphatase 2A regulatory subunit B'
MFLNEIEEILDIVDSANFATIAEHLFKRIARCISSPHFQVCCRVVCAVCRTRLEPNRCVQRQVVERALYLWNNDYIATLIHDYAEDILPLVFPALTTTARSHWNRGISILVENTLKTFLDNHAELYDRCREMNKAARTR